MKHTPEKLAEADADRAKQASMFFDMLQRERHRNRQLEEALRRLATEALAIVGKRKESYADQED